MRYLSVCSGIEAATVAWHPLGWTPMAFAEIERFPSSVLAHHYPTVPNHGDLTQFKDWPDADIDLLVGGTPCQSFSVAGLRAGLADPRGNLALTYLAVADRYRPRWVVWENVPGVLSADGGRALGAFLGGLGELGYGFAYRVLDAQYFGLAQRRQRVFVVGHLGDWRRAAAVLFERESLSGHPAPSREAGQSAPTIPSRSTAGGGLGTDFDCDGGLITNCGERERALTSSNQRIDYETETLIAHSLSADGFDASEDGTGRGTPIVPTLAPCLTQNYGKQPDNSDTNAGPLLIPYTLAIRGRGDSHDLGARQDGTANAVLTPNGGRGGIGVGAVAVPIDMRQASRGATMTNNRREGSSGGAPGTGIGEDGDPSPTIASTHVPAIAFSAKDHGADAGDISPTLRAGGHDGSHANGGCMPAVAFDARQSDVLQYGEKTGPLDTDGHSMAVAFHENQRAEVTMSDTAGALKNGGGKPGQGYSAVQRGMQVRRLTPRECERLQGFPDDYTLIPYRGKPAADGPRYKALGNSMAVPVMEWIGRRIQMVEDLP